METPTEEKRSPSPPELDKRSPSPTEDNKESAPPTLEENKMTEDVQMTDTTKDGKFTKVFIEWCNIDKTIRGSCENTWLVLYNAFYINDK